MRKLVAGMALLSAVLSIARGGVLSQTLRFDPSLVRLGEKDGYATVRYGNAPLIDALGVPALPELPATLVIPPTATVTAIEVANIDEQLLAGEYVVLPGQIGRQWRLNDPEPPFIAPNPVVYGADAVFPKEPVTYQVTGNKGGFRVAGFTVCPVRYNPVQRKLWVITRLDLKIHYAENTVPRARDFPRQIAEMSRDLEGMVLNPEDLGRFAPAVKYTGDPSPVLPPGYYEHVIVSPAIYADSFVRLRDWRTLQGMPSTIMTIENVCAMYPGRDTAERIRNFIKDARTTWGTIWVFLPRYDHPSRQYRAAYVSYSGTDILPCDLYFSDLDGSWDGNRNNIFGECPGDSITGFSDVYVGFIPIDNPGNVRNFLSKLFRYEQTPGAAYIEKVALVMGVTFSENYAESIAVNDPPSWTDFRCYVSRSVPAQAYIDSITAGYGYTCGIHHGDVNSVYHGSPALITSAQANALTNQKLGVFISVGCDPGAWDQTGNTNGDCLAENGVMWAPNAYVAIMMNARSGWVDVAEHYNFHFMYRIMPPTTPRCSNFVTVGQGLARAKDHWIPRWNLGGDTSRFRWEAYERNLFGEPAMQLWTREPGYCQATHAGVVTIGSNIPYPVTVTTTTDVPIESAMVVLWKGNEVYTKGRTDGNGQVTLYVSPTTPGTMVLAVNAHNYFLFVDTVRVISTARYVAHLRSDILDAPPGGNGDSILNPGEAVKIRTWVKNWGQQTANGVTAKLRTRDPNAQITDSVKVFGNIAAGDSAYTGDNGFGLQVNSGLNNGYTVNCSLICRDVLDSVWVSLVGYVVGTPVLAKATVTVKDSTHGNGNGKIDPGETSELEIEIKNNGLGHGYNCWALLRSGDSRFVILDSIATYGYIRRGMTANNADNRFLVDASASIPMETQIPCTLYTYADGGYVSPPQVFEIIVGEIRAVDPIPDGPRMPPLYYAYDNVDVAYPAHPTYNWIELRGRGTRLSLSDDQTVQITIPSAFGPLRYYGQDYTQLSICSNGFVALGYSTATSYTNYPLPSSNVPAPAVFVNWDDIYPPVGGGVWWMHDTAAHALVVEWDSVAYYSPQTVFDKYQIVFFDTTVRSPTGNNVIQFQYYTANNYTSNTVGLQDPTQSICIQALYNGSYHRGCAPLAPSRAIKFCTDLPTGVEESEFATTAASAIKLTAWPNPLTGLSTIRWTLGADGPVTLQVYDANGRLVRTLVNTRQKAGRYETVWDGKADNGQIVASGIYFYRLKTAAGSSELKTVVTR